VESSLLLQVKSEEDRVQQLFSRANSNGANVHLVGASELRQMEQNIEGTLALFSPETGIVDYLSIAHKLREIIAAKVHVALNETVVNIQEQQNQVALSTKSKTYFARRLIACAGLQADRIARIAGLELGFKIVPFRGEYFQLPASKNNIVKHLIYPAPDPKLPFLGVHLTRMIDGSVTVGPNAVLGWAREGYNKYSVDSRDLADFLRFPGFGDLFGRTVFMQSLN